MSDDIIKAAAKVIYANGYDEEYSERHYMTARAVLREVTPLIRAQVLEEAAKMVEQSTLVDYSLLKYFAADIRALKDQPGGQT